MSIEENKALARRFEEEVQNQRKFDVIDEIIATTYTNNGPQGSETLSREKLRERLQGICSMVPDFHDEMEEMVADGHFVAFRLTRSGTVAGEKKSLPGFHLFRVDNDKIAECWWLYEGMVCPWSSEST